MICSSELAAEGVGCGSHSEIFDKISGKLTSQYHVLKQMTFIELKYNDVRDQTRKATSCVCSMATPNPPGSWKLRGAAEIPASSSISLLAASALHSDSRLRQRPIYKWKQCGGTTGCTIEKKSEIMGRSTPSFVQLSLFSTAMHCQDPQSGVMNLSLTTWQNVWLNY